MLAPHTGDVDFAPVESPVGLRLVERERDDDDDEGAAA